MSSSDEAANPPIENPSTTPADDKVNKPTYEHVSCCKRVEFALKHSKFMFWKGLFAPSRCDLILNPNPNPNSNPNPNPNPNPNYNPNPNPNPSKFNMS